MVANHDLPASEESIVDLRQLFTIPVDVLQTLCSLGGHKARIQPLYREHLARHFADTFSRVGLPKPYPSHTRLSDGDTRDATQRDGNRPGGGSVYDLFNGATFQLAINGASYSVSSLAGVSGASAKSLPNDDSNPLEDDHDHDDLILWLAYKEANALIRFEAVLPRPGRDEAVILFNATKEGGPPCRRAATVLFFAIATIATHSTPRRRSPFGDDVNGGLFADDRLGDTCQQPGRSR
jgi:hypothetical protein